MYILENATVYTVEGSGWDKNPKQAMLVGDDGVILAVGNNEEIHNLAEDSIKIYDLKGKTVLPGFIDSHVHAPGTAFTELYQIDLFGVFDRQETLDTIRKYIIEHPEKEEYFGAGFNMGMIQEFLIDESPVEWLDEICGDKAIILQSYDCHSYWLNSCAMSKYGIGKEKKTTGNGMIHRNEDGTLKGIFTDVRDIGIPEAVYDEHQQKEALIRFAYRMNAWGYTSIMSIAPLISLSYDSYKALADEEKLTIRANLAVMVEEKTMDADFEKLIKLRKETANGELKVNTAKFMIDGVLEGNTAWLKQPYCIEAGMGEDYNSDPEWSVKGYMSALKKAADYGIQTHNHCIGDAAVTMVIDALKSVQGEELCEKLRNVITHLEVVDYDDIKKFAELGVIAAIQPFWHLKEPGFYDLVELPSLGKERAEKIYPAKSFVKAGVKITSSGDYPVSFMNNPFMGIRAGITRNLYSKEYYGEEINDVNDPRYLLNSDERLTVKDMIEAYTINGAYELFREDETGSLSKGKKADFIVLDKDPLKTDALEMDGIQVLATVMNGKAVYIRSDI